MDPDKFMRELFDDKLETEAWITANQNMHYIKNSIDDSKPRHRVVGDLVERLCPSWFQLPKHRKDQEASDIAEIDFFRDLGPYARRLVKPYKERQDCKRT